MVVLPICLWVRHERACVRNVLVSQFECVCATNVPVGELRVHRCLSSAIVLMCLCHLCLPFCHLCVILSAILPSLCHLCVCHFAICVSFVCLPFAICVSFVCCVMCFVFAPLKAEMVFFRNKRLFVNVHERKQ